jgi:hypothetical protein
MQLSTHVRAPGSNCERKRLRSAADSVLFDVAAGEALLLVVVFAAKAALVATTSAVRTIRGVRIESSSWDRDRRK